MAVPLKYGSVNHRRCCARAAERPGLRAFCYHEGVGRGDRSAPGIAETFAALVGRQVEDERIPLARAALIIARTEYPDLDIEQYLRRLDEMAERVRRLQGDLPDASETMSKMALAPHSGLSPARHLGAPPPPHSSLNSIAVPSLLNVAECQ